MAAAEGSSAGAPSAQPLVAQCVAAQASVGRGPQLLACVPGTGLLVAAAGSQVLLLQADTGGVHPAGTLVSAATSIAGVAVHSSGGSSGSGTQHWAAALAGGTALIAPVSPGGAASAAGCVRFEVPAGSPGWHACAWHPAQAVCALAAPHQLLLVTPVDGSGGSSSSSDAEDGSGGGATSDGRVLAAVPFPGCGGTSASAAGGRCCVAWLRGGDGGRGGAAWQLVVSQGPSLELLAFDSGWQLLERRELLAGLAGPICGLAAAGQRRLLLATQRPLADWLSLHGEQPQQTPQQQEQHAAEVDEAPSVLLRGLQQVQQREQLELVLPASPRSGSRTPRQLLQPPPAEASPLAAAVEAAERAAGSPPRVIDVTQRHVRRASSAPAIPAHFLLDSGEHMPLEAGLPALPLSPRPEAGAEGGQAALLWLAGSSTPAAAPAAPAGSSSPHAAAAAAAAEELELAADLMVPAPGSLLLLASSRRSPPALLLCTADRHRLRPHGALVRLQLPAEIPSDCSVKLRGLALSPAASGGGGNGKQLVWALLAAAPRPQAAPFFSATLAGPSPQQLWLCCYSLQQLAQLAEAAEHSGGGAPASPAEQQRRLRGAAAARPAAPQPAVGSALAASAPGSAAQAVQALQGELAALRQEVNARLDSLAAQLDGVLRALQRPSR